MKVFGWQHIVLLFMHYARVRLAVYYVCVCVCDIATLQLESNTNL